MNPVGSAPSRLPSLGPGCCLLILPCGHTYYAKDSEQHLHLLDQILSAGGLEAGSLPNLT